MKVLLVGEFSNVHNTLQQGLRELGVTVDTLNAGDGYRKFHSDIRPVVIKNHFIRKQYNDIFVSYLSHKYDVIQFMHECEWGRVPGLNLKAAVPLARNARLSVLLSAGCNWEYFKYGKEKVGISPCEECLKYDCKGQCYKVHQCHHYHSSVERKVQYAMQKTVKMIVPMCYEYDVCDKSGPFADKVVHSIGMPIKTAVQGTFAPTDPSKKLIVYHPLNRRGFKGTVMVEKAFDILREKFGDTVEFVIQGGMPYEQYTQFIRQVDIIVDQKNDVTFGMASLQAMAERKILITGNYRNRISDPDYAYLKSAPAFELGTTVEEIVNNIASVIERRSEFDTLREKGAAYVRANHDYKKIARQFLDLYEEHLCGAYK